MKLVVSIPVHEKPDVINNQIENFQKYIKDVSIVLHVSDSFFKQYTLSDIKSYKDVYINPEHLKTTWSDILKAHISNFHFIQSKIDFDYFILHASNDMYIKYGFQKYVQQFDAGFHVRKVTKNNSHWWVGNKALQDTSLRKMMGYCNQEVIIGSQVESSFYKKELLIRIIEIIEKFYSPSKIQTIYPREEIYFSTIASALVESNAIGGITTFSEVHRFDRLLWKIRDFTRKLYDSLGGRWIFSEDFYYKIERFYGDKLFKSRFYKTTPRIIRRLLKEDIAYINRNSYLDDGSGKFRLYNINIFSVKRINRTMDDTVRRYITNLP